MTHPFALSIDDLACLELVETEPPIGGVDISHSTIIIFHPAPPGKRFSFGPGDCVLTLGYHNETGGYPGNI